MNSPVVFCDFHHAGLAYSLRLLIKRLGGTCLFPIGTEWFERGYWQIAKPYNNNPDTVKQFLQIKPEYTHRQSHPLNTIVAETADYYEIADHYHQDTMRSITFEQFCAMPIDVVIASIPDHWESFGRLIKDHKPRAKLICQMGNIGWHEEATLNNYHIDNLLASVLPFKSPAKNTCFYHQEIPIKPFKQACQTPKIISSFVHLFPGKENFMDLKATLTQYQWRAFGAQADSGVCATLTQLEQLIAESQFVHHNKPRGDGFGHLIHTIAMLGRIPLVNFSDYQDKLASQFLIPDKTCIDLSIGTQAIASKIKTLEASQELYNTMNENLHKTFLQAVNYEQEAAAVRAFFTNLL